MENHGETELNFHVMSRITMFVFGLLGCNTVGKASCVSISDEDSPPHHPIRR